MRNKNSKMALMKAFIWKLTIAVLVVFSFSYPFLVKPPELLPEKPIRAEIPKPLPDFKLIENVVDKKTAFFEYLQPEVARQNEYLIVLRLTIKAIYEEYKQNNSLTNFQRKQLVSLQQEYKIDTELSIDEQFQQLLRRVDIIPEDLVLVQAANESAWGTSRFAQQGYNFFGLWCFRKGCGFVPKRRDDDAAHEVAKFKDLSHATYTYMRNLNRHPAYKHLREIRSKLRAHQKPITGIALSEGLLQYSERGEDYIDELQHMIRFNREFFD